MIAMLSIYISVDRDTQKAARLTLNLGTRCEIDLSELYMWAMPEVRQTVAMLPVCVLPEAMLLRSVFTWCFGD